MLRLVLFVLLCRIVVLPWNLCAQSPGPEPRFRFEGVTRLRVGTLETALREAGLTRMLPSLRDSLPRVLYTRYAAEGHYAMRVDSMFVGEGDSIAVPVTVWVDEGPPYLVGVVELRGLRASDSLLASERMDTRSGSPFSDVVLGEDLDRVLEEFASRGFPFATASVLSALPREDLLDLRIRIDTGEVFTIDEITVEGNTVTDPEVIVRELRLRPGTRFNGRILSDLRRRVEKLNLFQTVEEPRLVQRAGRGGLLMRVTEGSTNTIDGLVGYLPPAKSGESGQVTGLVSLSFRNLFGTARRLDARWERASSSVTEWELRYLEPWLLGWPINAQGGFHQRQQDSTYVRRSVDVRLTVLWNENLNFTASFTAVSSIPTARLSGFAFDRSQSLGGGLEMLIDTRDNPYQPRAGITLRNAYHYASKTITPVSGGEERTASLQRFEADLALFQELPAGFVLAPSLHGRELRGGERDPGDEFRLGGARTLRGYREEQFLGNRLLWTNAELRYGIGRRSFLFLFYDLGYVQRDAEPGASLKTWKSGYGVGARLETGLGVLSVSFALGEGDGFSEGKIHVGVVNDF